MRTEVQDEWRQVADLAAGVQWAETEMIAAGVEPLSAPEATVVSAPQRLRACSLRWTLQPMIHSPQLTQFADVIEPSSAVSENVAAKDLENPEAVKKLHRRMLKHLRLEKLAKTFDPTIIASEIKIFIIIKKLRMHYSTWTFFIIILYGIKNSFVHIADLYLKYYTIHYLFILVL